MARVRKPAADVSPEKAAVLGPNVMVWTDEVVGDEPVLRIEQAPDDFEDVELAKRRARDAEVHEAWLKVGGDGSMPRPATPLKGSLCSFCGAADRVLSSPGASGPWRCAWGCD